jgi:hypothetical protein
MKWEVKRISPQTHTNKYFPFKNIIESMKFINKTHFAVDDVYLVN